MNDKDRKKLIVLMRKWAECLRDGSALSLNGLPEPTVSETGLASVYQLLSDQIQNTL